MIGGDSVSRDGRKSPSPRPVEIAWQPAGPEEGQFWKARLKAGQQVTILWGSSGDTVTGLDVYPPGTHRIEGSDDRRLTYQSIGGDPTKLTFTAPRTGMYPIVFDDSCGSPGPFHFVLITAG